MLLRAPPLAAVAICLGVAQAQQLDRCESEFQNSRPANLPRLCWPSGSLSGNADDWSCSAECAAVFVPFWEACGETVLETTTLVGQDFAPFYNLCRAGMIGRAATPRAQRRCTSGNFNTRKAAAEAVCCPDADSCAGNPSLPTHCSLQCAVAYSEFYEDCAAVAAASHSKVVDKMQQFHRTCIDEADTAELLIVLSDMPQNSCSIDTSVARATADGGTMMAGGQVWLGSYICAQGNTNLQLVVVDVSAEGMVNALFSFETDSGCAGRYQLSGLMADAPGGRPGAIKQLTLVPEQGGASSQAGWIENPCGYVSVGMSGTVSQADNGDLVYQGTIDFAGCDTFLVTLPTASPALFCPNTDAGWLLGSTMCYSRFEEEMSLEDAERFCQDLDGLAHVAVVPTLDDLNFLTVQIDQHGYHTYNLGATCPGTDKTLCNHIDGSPVTITPEGYCFEARPDSVCDEPDSYTGNTQLGVNSNGLLDASPAARPFFCSMPPQRASSSRACENDLSGTWEGDQTSGNNGNGASDGSRFVTTIIESGSTYTEEFVAFRTEHMECSDPSGDADQSTRFHDGTSQYVSFESCQQGCLHDDSCNGMIEYGTDICDTHIDPLSQRPVCSGGPGRCIAENLCTCYLVTGTCAEPISHPNYMIWRMHRTPAVVSSFTAYCANQERCDWFPPGFGGQISQDRTRVTLSNGLVGVLAEDGNEIVFENGYFWTRLSECGSFGHERVPLPVPGGFAPGDSLVCQGVWPSGDSRFSVNLMTRDDDIALHVNPRDCVSTGATAGGCSLSTRGQVVRNTRVGGAWGAEERSGSLPLRHDSTFLLRITAGQTDYRITFEGESTAGEYGGTGTFGLLAEGAECSDGTDPDQSVQWRDGISQYVSFDQCEAACLADGRCADTIEYGIASACTGAGACKCWLVLEGASCSNPIPHASYSIYQLGRAEHSSSTFTYAYRSEAPPSAVTHVAQEDHTLQWCDFNVAPRVNLATTTFQGDTWTLVRRVKQGDTWHPATDELLGTDEYGIYGDATSDSTFSIPFGDNGRSDLHWDKIMFASGDMSMWVILDKAEMDRCTDGHNKQGQWHPTIAAASGHAAPYSVLQYCRRGNEEDPWISVEEHPSQVVYGEGSFNVAQWCGGDAQCPSSCYLENALDPSYQCPNTCTHCNDDAIIGHGGANVWVRTTTAGGGHRRAQANQFHLPTIDHCAASHLQDRLERVNSACCPNGQGCNDGLPEACDIECAMEYAKFYSDCYVPLVETFGMDSNSQFQTFHTTCMHTFDTGSLLNTAATATNCQ